MTRATRPSAYFGDRSPTSTLVGGVWVANTETLPAPAVPTIRQLSNRVSLSTADKSNANLFSKQGATYRTRHKVRRACSTIQLAYSNLGLVSGGDNAFTLGAMIEKLDGTQYPLTFNGASLVTLQPRDHVVSDPKAIIFAAGDEFWIRSYGETPSIGPAVFWPVCADIIMRSSQGEGVDRQTGVNRTILGATWPTGVGAIEASPSVAAAKALAPYAIFGVTSPTDTKLPIALMGDSIAVGAGDTYWESTTANSSGGYMVRACEAALLPYALFGQGGRAMSDLTNAARRVDWFDPLILEKCVRGIINMGRNDLTNGRTLAQLQANSIDVWTYLTVTRGTPKLWQTTITPYTDSSDAWATTGNQTPNVNAQNTRRNDYNNWLRDGAPMLAGVAVVTGTNAGGTIRAGAAGHPLAGYFEVANAAETAQDSGIWKAGYTSDGLHPNAVGYAALAAAINTATLIA